MGVNLSREGAPSPSSRGHDLARNHAVLRIDFSNLKEARRESGGARLKWLPRQSRERTLITH